MSRPKPRVPSQPKKAKAPRPRVITAVQDLDALWAASRHGANNVAGVRYQTVVGLHLLIEGYARTLPVVAVTPEGLEDLDCEVDGGEGLLVQAKERSEPVGFTLVADVIEHAGGPASVEEDRPRHQRPHSTWMGANWLGYILAHLAWD